MIINTPIITGRQSGYFNVVHKLYEGRYPFISTVVQSPTNPNVLLVLFNDWILGHRFTEQNSTAYIKSIDGGITWSGRTIIYNPGAGFGVMSTGAGVDPTTGRIYFHSQVSAGTGNTEGTTNKTIVIGYTENEGVDWTITDHASLLPNNDPVRTQGQIIYNNGVLMFPFYNTVDLDGPSNRFLARNDGGGWTRILVENSADYINEADIIASNNNVIQVVRSEVTKEWIQYKSTDNGLNWTNQGNLTFGESLATPGPVMLAKFLLDGVEVWACYYLDRANFELNVIYGLPADIIAGTSGWNTSTKRNIYVSPGCIYHYGGVCHPYNDLRAVGSYAFDNMIGWNPDTATTQLHVFELQSRHKAELKSQLGI